MSAPLPFRQTAANSVVADKTPFDFNGSVPQATFAPGRHVQCSPGQQDCYPSPLSRSGASGAGPVFAESVLGQSSADGGDDRADVQFFCFPFSNIPLGWAVIKTLHRGSISCSRQLSSPRLWSRPCFPAVSARTATHRPTAQLSARSVGLQRAPSSLTPRVAAKPKARLSVRSSAACRAASKACQPATDLSRFGGTQHHSRPFGVAPRMAFSFGGRLCSKKS